MIQDKEEYKMEKDPDSNVEKKILKRKNAEESSETIWKKFKTVRKQLRIERKQKDSGTLYEVNVKSKQIWEELRRNDCTESRKSELSSALYELVKGNLKSLIVSHDMSRVIQTLVSTCQMKHRDAIFIELRDSFLTLSKSVYARHFVLKMVKVGSPKQKDAILQAFVGHIPKLLAHRISCDVVQCVIRDVASSKQRLEMMHEFYGPHFQALKAEGVASLEEAFMSHVDLKDVILRDLLGCLQPILDKGLYTNEIIHTLLKEYLTFCSDADRTAVIDSIHAGLLPIIHTKDGAKVGMMCVWYSSAKMRKAILKSFKGHYQKIASEEHGFIVLLAIIDCIDDTVFMKKVVFSELLQDLEKIITSEAGKKVLSYLIAPRNKEYCHSVNTILEAGDGNAHSKKDAHIRYAEIKNIMIEPVYALLEVHLPFWVFDKRWTLFVALILNSLHGSRTVEVFKALREYCCEFYVPGKENHIFNCAHATKLITLVIKHDSVRFAAGMDLFSSVLLGASDLELQSWVLVNRGCFFFVTMIETEIESICDRVKKVVAPVRGKLEKLSFKGAEILLQKIK